MCPYIHTPIGDLSIFTCCAALGIVSMFVGVYLVLRRSAYREREINYIVPKIAIAGLCGFLFAVFTDFVFKYIRYGVVKVYGMAFYGALIGASAVMYLLLKYSKGRTEYTMGEWFDMLTPPFLCFHFWGRIGCFFGGCCYGLHLDSAFSVTFPDNVEMGIIHNGMKCLPTQLFEAAAIMVILLIVCYSRRKYLTYIVLYAVVRFALEFLRGDDRGYAFGWLSPAQVISILILSVVGIWGLFDRSKRNKRVPR